MKKSLVVLSLLLASSAAWSWEFKNNPDRVPSVGLNYSGTWLSGTGTFDPVPGFVFRTEDDLKDRTNQGVADLRLPVSNNLTLSVGGGYVKRSVDRIDTGLLPLLNGGIAVVGDKLSDDFSGPTFNVGARYYFN